MPQPKSKPEPNKFSGKAQTEPVTEPVDDGYGPDLTEGLAIAAGPPVPIRFFGKKYKVRKGYTADEVLEFFDFNRQHAYPKILELVLCEGDPEEFWNDMKVRSVPEMLQVYLPNVYKAAGLMNEQGEFLAL